MQITAVAPDFSDFQNRGNVVAADGPRLGVRRRAATSSATRGKWGEEAAQKLKAKPVEVGRYDLVLHPSHLWLTIHESIAPSDRARPRDGLRGELRRHQLRRAAGASARQAQVRPGVHEHPGRPLAGRRARDDRLRRRGREAGRVPDHQERHLQRLPDHARAGELAQVVVRPAEAADAVARLLLRATRGRACSSSACRTSRCCRASRTSSWEDLIAATDRGIAIIGDGSFSIDQQRYNAQFGGQVFYEIKGGKIVGHAEGRRVSDAHAGFLELDGHDRREVELRAGRASSTARASRGRSTR